MIQVGPLISVHLPKDRVNQVHQGFGFAEFVHEKDAEYASNVMNGIRLYGKILRVNKALQEKQKNIDVGADLYIGNLDPMVNEALLQETFSTFGVIIHPPRVARDPDTGESKGYAFLSFDSFEASDRAMEAMNGQYIMNNPVTINYAFKRDGKGERHGDESERLLAAQAKKNNYQLPSQQQIPLGGTSIPQQITSSVPAYPTQIPPQLNNVPAFPTITPPNFRNGPPMAPPPSSTNGLPMRPGYSNGGSRR